MITFIGIGSNLENPIQQVKIAINYLNQIPNTHLIATSSLYQTPPLGPQDQPDFINAVAKLETKLTAFELFKHLQTIEETQGRVREVRWGPRIIDLDILLYGNEIIQHEKLVIPHPEIKSRAFVIYPLAEIASNLILPTGENINVLLTQYRTPSKIS